MPLYEYECGNCGRKFEELVRASAVGHQPACPGCGKTSTRRLISSCRANVGGLGSALGSASLPSSSGCGGGGDRFT